VTRTALHAKNSFCAGEEEEYHHSKVGSVRKAYPPVNLKFHQTNKLASQNRQFIREFTDEREILMPQCLSCNFRSCQFPS
jgi:hypothetical protein